MQANIFYILHAKNAYGMVLIYLSFEANFSKNTKTVARLRFRHKEVYICVHHTRRLRTWYSFRFIIILF